MVASLVFLNATSVTNSALLKDSVAILFLNYIDEQVYIIVRQLRPSWVKNLDCEIESYCSKYQSSSSAANNTNEDEGIMVESTTDTNSIMSRVEANSKLLRAGRNYYFDDLRMDEGFRGNSDDIDQCMSMLFTHIENLNDQIKELHDVIAGLKSSEIRELRKDLRIIKSQICL